MKVVMANMSAGSPGQQWVALSQTAKDARRGRAVYEAMCMVCHGQRGDGKGPYANQLHSNPFDFTDPANRNCEKEENYFASMVAGRKGTNMPSWFPKLSVFDMRHIIAYLRKLGEGVFVAPGLFSQMQQVSYPGFYNNSKTGLPEITPLPTNTPTLAPTPEP